MNGGIAKKTAIGLLGNFIVENLPLFNLYRYDEDFISELIVCFLEKGEKIFEYYNPEKTEFFTYFYYFVCGIISSQRKNLQIAKFKDSMIFEENITTYYSKEYKYDIKNSFETKMFSSQPKIEYKSMSLAELKEFYNKLGDKYSDKKILVLALKSSFYLTENQIKNVCLLYKIEEQVLYDTIQYCKTTVFSKYSKREKAIERRNFNYYHHKRCCRQLTELDEYFNNNESTTKNRLMKLEHRHHQNWININTKFEQGFMFLRPTNKIIGEILGISERQVSYYINCAKIEVKRKENNVE